MTRRIEYPIVFANQQDAEGTVHEMMRIGLAGDELDLVVHEPGHSKSDAEKGLIRSAVVGMIIGIPVATIIAGFLVYLGAGPGTLTAGGLFLASMWEGILAGVFLGGVVGLATKMHTLEGSERWSTTTPIERDQVLLVSHLPARPSMVREIVERHHGRILEPPRAA